MMYESTLPFKPSGGVLPLLIQKQPGVDNIPTTIKVNGKKMPVIDLRSDVELKLSY